MTTMNFQITGMHCGGCATTVRQQVEQVPGTQSLTVDPTSGTLTIDGDDVLDAAAVVRAVEQAGYQAVRT